MDALGVVIVIAMIILNIVGIVWLGFVLEHPFLVPLGYTILLIIIGNINGIACIVVALIVAFVTITVKIVSIIRDKKQQKEETQRSNDLLDAVKRGDKQTAQKLIENGADIHYCGPLVTAVENGDKEMVSLLIKKGAYINSANGKSLVMAVKNGNKDITSLLIEKGATVNLGYDGKLPLDFAQDEEIIAILKSHGAKTKEEQNILDIDFVSAVRHGDIVKVKDLIPQISNIDIIIPGHELVSEIFTPTFGDWVEDVIVHREIVMQKVREETTPLMYAASVDDIEMVKILTENGAKVNASDSHGRTGLMYVAIKHDVQCEHSVEIIDFLTSKGADVNAKYFNDVDSDITALMIATTVGNIEIVEALIRNGANVNARTTKGTTALSAARTKRYTEIENLLRKSGARY